MSSQPKHRAMIDAVVAHQLSANTAIIRAPLSRTNRTAVIAVVHVSQLSNPEASVPHSAACRSIASAVKCTYSENVCCRLLLRAVVVRALHLRQLQQQIFLFQILPTTFAPVFKDCVVALAA
jgi:hypothetical protein